MTVDDASDEPDQGRASERANIPGTIHAPTVSSRSGRSESRGWNGWVSASRRSSKDRQVFRQVPFRREQCRGSVAGNSIGTVLLLAALVAFFVCIFMLWIRREAVAGRGETERTKLGTAARLGDLPEGIRPEDADPWAEAQRRRAAGDLAGAVVCLFAHQLLTPRSNGLDPARARTDRPALPPKPARSRVDRRPGRDPRVCSRMSTTVGGRPPPRRLNRSGVGPSLFQERQRTLGARVSS